MGPGSVGGSMTLDLAFSMKVFAALFAIMNPIATIPVFLSLTEGGSGRDKRRVARVALIGVTIGCVVSAAAGSAILSVFGVTANDFRLAGGLLVLLIALNMLHGSSSSQDQPTEKELSWRHQRAGYSHLSVDDSAARRPGNHRNLDRVRAHGDDGGKDCRLGIAARRFPRAVDRSNDLRPLHRALSVPKGYGDHAATDGHDSRCNRRADDLRQLAGFLQGDGRSRQRHRESIRHVGGLRRQRHGFMVTRRTACRYAGGVGMADVKQRYKPCGHPAGGWGAAAATAKVLMEQSAVTKGSRAVSNEPTGRFQMPGLRLSRPGCRKTLAFRENFRVAGIRGNQTRVHSGIRRKPDPVRSHEAVGPSTGNARLPHGANAIRRGF
jgi:MarC family integral membrane protein